MSGRISTHTCARFGFYCEAQNKHKNRVFSSPEYLYWHLQHVLCDNDTQIANASVCVCFRLPTKPSSDTIKRRTFANADDDKKRCLIRSLRLSVVRRRRWHFEGKSNTFAMCVCWYCSCSGYCRQRQYLTRYQQKIKSIIPHAPVAGSPTCLVSVKKRNKNPSKLIRHSFFFILIAGEGTSLRAQQSDAVRLTWMPCAAQWMASLTIYVLWTLASSHTHTARCFEWTALRDTFNIYSFFLSIRNILAVR